MIRRGDWRFWAYVGAGLGVLLGYAIPMALSLYVGGIVVHSAALATGLEQLGRMLWSFALWPSLVFAVLPWSGEGVDLGLTIWLCYFYVPVVGWAVVGGLAGAAICLLLPGTRRAPK